jgi:4-hydroxy-2-oxoheptanedioate aldolase
LEIRLVVINQEYVSVIKDTLMKINELKQRLQRNEPVFITTLHLADPLVYELASLIGVDGIWLDMEHRPFTLETTKRLITAAKAGGNTDVIVRTSRHEYPLVTRVLECGAQGVIYPRCSDADEAREVVRAAKFAPIGARGCDGWGRDAPFGTMPIEDYVRTANEQTLVIVQIESPDAVEQAEAIALVEGVDALMFGMGDYSVLSGVPGQVHHEKVIDASRRVRQAALKAGKHFGQPVPSLEAAEEMIAEGGLVVFHNADVLMINRGLRNMKEQIDQLRQKLIK